MEHLTSHNHIFLRLDPGEELITSLAALAADLNHDFFAITSGVGMVTGLKFGFFCDTNNDYDITEIPGILDLNNITGNIARKAGIWTPHVHLIVNRPDFTTLSGHLIRAVTHITMELTLHAPIAPNLTRRTAPGRPASYLSAK